jgi:hypothetical protein
MRRDPLFRHETFPLVAVISTEHKIYILLYRIKKTSGKSAVSHCPR